MTEPRIPHTQAITLKVEGMTCDGCERTVATALAQAGLEDPEVDWRRGIARGRAGEGFSLDAAAEVLEGSHYRVAGIVEETSSEPHVVTGAGEGPDLLVIGSGSAAFAAAIKARDLGASVTLVERGTIGGTCVNIGCVPSKALLAPAVLYWDAGHHPYPGIATSADGVDMAALIAGKDELVEVLRQEKYADLLDVYGIDFIQGEARFVDEDTIEVDGRQMTAGRYLIATGASPWVPPIPGLDEVDYLTSTTALDLTEVPGELIVVGANAIGLELGQLFHHLGAKVTFVEALDRIAPFEEPEISSALREYLESQGARVLQGATARRAFQNGDRVGLEVETAEGVVVLDADRLLMATGRRANTGALNLDAAGVETDPRGAIVVEATMATSNPKVFAAGDCTTSPQFVYVAAAEGNLAAENALRETGREMDFRTMPRVTFTAPSIASVGLTEAQAREAGRAVMTSVLPLSAVPRALVERDTDGLVKLVADEATGELLGAHVLARGAGDVIQAAVMAIRYRATVDEIAETFHAYLTMAESLKLAAQGFRKDVKHLSCCAA